MLPLPIEIEIGKNSDKYMQLDVCSELCVSRCALMALRHVHPRLDKSENSFSENFWSIDSLHQLLHWIS